MVHLHDFLDLVLPTRCSICRRLGSIICENCASNFETNAKPVSREANGKLLRGFRATDYDEPCRLLIHAFKEKGHTALSRFMGQKLGTLLLEFDFLGGPEVFLVPVPSSRANYIKRGYKPSVILAKAAARSAAKGIFRVSDSLRFSRVVEDQAKLQTAGRAMNLAGSMVANQSLVGRKVILVDDIVTTGATLLESARAASAAGAEVVGFITFAETLLKTPAKN